MVKGAKKIINWAFEDNAGFFISEYPCSFEDRKITAYFVFRKYLIGWFSFVGVLSTTCRRGRNGPQLFNGHTSHDVQS